MTFLYIVVALVIIFDFINGFHDSANSISTVVSTRVLSPKYAVLWAAYFNFVAAFQKENIIGVQFHPEGFTRDGSLIFKNFLKICNCNTNVSQEFEDEFYNGNAELE